MKSAVTIPMSAGMQRATLNVRVTGARLFRVRMVIGTWLIRCAALALGCRFHLEVKLNAK